MDHEDAFDLLSVVSLRLAEATAAGCASLGLTVSEARVITCLATHGPGRSGTVAGRVGLSPRRMTQVMEGLDLKGFTRRHPDPVDARAKQVELTLEGVRLAADISTLRSVWATELLADVTAPDLAALTGTLRSVLLRLDP